LSGGQGHRARRRPAPEGGRDHGGTLPRAGAGEQPGTSQIVPWKVKPDGKYWRGLLAAGIKLDLFIADPTNFGLILAIRTGSGEFTTALVTRAKEVGLPSVDGYLTRGGERVVTPEEEDVFELLGLEWTDPALRHSFNSLVRKAALF
jgi:DNA polymerase beta thumb